MSSGPAEAAPSQPGPRRRAVTAPVRAFRALPIRWRLAGTSAALTLFILCAFAMAVGTLTSRRIRSDFDHQTFAAAEYLRNRITVTAAPGPGGVDTLQIEPNLDVYAGPGHAAIRVLDLGGSVLRTTRSAPDLGSPFGGRTVEFNGYRVETRAVDLRTGGTVFVQYARPLSDLDATLSRLNAFLIFGVLAGTGLALMAGVMIARRAMAPIAALTATASGIARTRDPRARVPQAEADDEVAELARTLDGMLSSLAEARGETEAMLARQREFVADASHELRTPLTSVLANLELLSEALEGEEGDAARAALRSSRRMRRLVEDLLVLARADAGRAAARTRVDLAEVAVEAAAELGPLSDGHELTVDAREAPVIGARDELVRVALNLIENAIRHTPRGTRIRVDAGVDGGRALLRVADTGPGIDEETAQRLFERFVRGRGESSGSFGIGLAIVRAVAESHGGGVYLEPGGPGASFVVSLPVASEPVGSAAPTAQVRPAGQR